MRNRFLALLGLSLLLASTTTPAFAAPPVPASLVITSSSAANAATDEAAIRVSWTGSTDASVVGYSVSVTGNGQTFFPNPICVSTSCNASLDGLNGGSAYTATVTAVAADGTSTSATSTPFTAQTSPGAPQELTSTVVGANLVLTWSPPSSTGGLPITSYVLTADGVSAINVSGTSSSYTVTGLSKGTKKFSIVAKNANGSSPQIDFDSQYIPSTPSQPSAPLASATGQLVSVTWTAPDSGGSAITRYELNLYRNGSFVDTVAGGVDASINSYDFSVVTPGTYTAKVAARNALGLSPYSAFSNGASVSGGTALASNSPVFTPSTLGNLAVGLTHTISASAPSGESVAIVAISNPLGACSLVGSTVTALAPGTCTLRANADATETYDAGQSAISFRVGRNQTISFISIGAQNFPGSLTLTNADVFATSNLQVSLSVNGNCTISGSSITFTSLGSCSVTASQSGDSNEWFAAASVTRTFQISSQPAGGDPSPKIAPTLVSRPKITGTAQVGASIKADTGRWEASSALNYEYEWYRCATNVLNPEQVSVAASCAKITGAFLSQYMVGEADRDFYLLVAVKATASGVSSVGYSLAIEFGETKVVSTVTPATWTKKLNDSSAKIYAKNIVGAGKVQFFLNGKEIAWVNAATAADSKLRTANGFSYLVRTVELVKGKKNVLEVYVDGVRTTRTAYSY